MEISPKQVALARELMALNNLFWDARIWSAFALKNDLEPAFFDLIFGQGILHHPMFDLQRVYVDCSELLKVEDTRSFLSQRQGCHFFECFEKKYPG